jgi:ribonuclease HII
VRDIASRVEREVKYQEKELQRLRLMSKYENEYYKKGAVYIAGIDEVGRGPLAGPVYASAVILPAGCLIEGVNDSKKLSPDKRKLLYTEIKKHAVSYATGYSDVETIDSINILNATYAAMRQAISKLTVKPQVILVDAVRIPGVDIFQVPIIKGDSLSISIAAASIIAKVERDALMDEYHREYPEYNFQSNKGYGTKEHIDAIKRNGLCPIHRRSFTEGII